MPLARSISTARRRGLVALWLMGGLLVTGCRWNTWIPSENVMRSAPQEIEEEFEVLRPGDTTTASLDCPAAGECQRHYRIVLTEPAMLHIEVDPDFATEEVGLRVILQGPAGQVIEQRFAEREGVVAMDTRARVGSIFVLVQSVGGRVDYTLLTAASTLTEPLPDPVPPPRPLPQPDPIGDRADAVGIDSAWDPEIDFSTYRNYAFTERPEDQLDAEPGTNVSGVFLDQEIQRAVRLELLDRGFFQTSEEEADFLVSTSVGGRKKTRYRVGHVYYTDSYGMWFDRWSVGHTTLAEYRSETATLVIDFIDVRKEALTWHGWTTEQIRDSTDPRVLIREVASKVLGLFPPE